MRKCILCRSTVKRFVFLKRFDKSRNIMILCKPCKQSYPIMIQLLSSHTEDHILDLLQKTDIVKVFKCLTAINKQKYKNSTQYKLLMNSLLKLDFTQTLIDNIDDASLIPMLLSYPTKIQWRKMYNNHTVLEWFLLNITDLKVVDLLRKKISRGNNYLYLSSAAPPPYSSLNIEEPFLPSAPLDTISSGFPGKWLLLYNNN